MIDTIIFDLDGTLLNTLTDLTNAVNYALVKNGCEIKTESQIKSYIGNGIKKLVQLSIPNNISKNLEDKVFQDFQEFYFKKLDVYTKPYTNIIDLLEILKSKNYKMGIVSNKNQKAVDSLYEKYYSKYIDIVIGECDHIKRKPSNDGINKVMEYLKTNKEKTIYIGDSEVDKLTADNAGIKCVLVSWGFRDKEDLKKLNPDFLIDSPLELLDILNGGIL